MSRPFTVQQLEAERAYVSGLLRRRVESREDAEDLAQEVLLRAWRYRERFRGECALRSWLHEIALRALIDHHRRQHTHPAALWLQDLVDGGAWLPCEDPGPETVALDRAELGRLLDLLEHDWAGPLLWLFVDGAAEAEVAQTYGVSTGTVKSRVARCRRRLREGLNAG